ncbi:DUF7521 family protein [Natronobacterium gregoryi]|nr:hypothetical protein [Natronobacterium gregoryi]AFZ73012.1 hypothetical protein Natgr_1821 [Natronobacterium gregoryi SP2]PLK18372.1 hypothetical protein CYV19_18035 [Natronobacterium gregoryi SP2]SFJ71546.1 hypothetical protein SAMN05443661_1645 [Natronobacterium gregoryi]
MSPAVAEASATIALAIVKTLILLVGSVITFFTFKAYRRTKQRSLGLLAVGFGLITLGLVLAGLLFELLDVALITGVLLESLLMLAGFLVIAYSLYVN